MQLEPVAAAKSVELAIDVEGPGRARVDADSLDQVLRNLFDNAVRYSPEDGTVRLRVGAAASRDRIRVSVSDDGPGIPLDIQDKIFYPMITGRPEGTGLGLSIAQSLINQHNGIIEFESEPGNTVFTVYLPLEVTNDQS